MFQRHHLLVLSQICLHQAKNILYIDIAIIPISRYKFKSNHVFVGPMVNNTKWGNFVGHCKNIFAS